MCAAKYSAAASILSNRSRLVPGAGSPARYRGATRSSQARLYKAPTVSLILGSRITRNRHRYMLPPLGAQTPASRIFRIKSFGTGSGFNRRIEGVVLMISNRSTVFGGASGTRYLCTNPPYRTTSADLIAHQRARHARANQRQ